MQQFTTADWVVVGTFVVGAIATFVAAWRARRGDAGQETELQQHLRLHPDDRNVISQILDALHSVRDAMWLSAGRSFGDRDDRKKD